VKLADFVENVDECAKYIHPIFRAKDRSHLLPLYEESSLAKSDNCYDNWNAVVYQGMSNF